jgi:hypothetical protein
VKTEYYYRSKQVSIEIVEIPAAWRFKVTIEGLAVNGNLLGEVSRKEFATEDATLAYAMAEAEREIDKANPLKSSNRSRW